MIAYFWATLAVALATITCYALTPLLLPSNFSAFYLLVVCWLAYTFGQGPSLLASTLSAVCFDFFFVAPHYALGLRDREYLFTFFSLLGVSLLISRLTAAARHQAQTARQRELESLALLEFTRALSEIRGELAVIEILQTHLSQRLGTPVRYSQAGQETSPSESYKVLLDRNGSELGRLYWSHGEFPTFLEAFIHQASLAIERERLSLQAQQAEIYRASEQLQTTLLNCISHDFRSPLVAILGALESLQSVDGLSQADRRLLVGNAIRETDRLNRFVANLMHINRLESGHLSLRLEEQDVSEVVQASLQLVRDSSRIRVLLPSELPLVLADFALLQQALWNLLDNALKFTQEVPVEIGAQEAAAGLELWVRDFGAGVAAEHTELVFTRFFRGPSSVKGSGLGLPICKGLILAMGGSVRVEGASPGARFVIWLPVAQPSHVL